MLETIAIIFACLISLLLVGTTFVVMAIEWVADFREYRFLKQAKVYQGIILGYESKEEYSQMISGKARAIAPQAAYKYYEKYRIQFTVEGKEYIESVLLNERSEIGSSVEVKCFFNAEEGELHPIDIGRTERFRAFIHGMWFIGVLVLLYFILSATRS